MLTLTGDARFDTEVRINLKGLQTRFRVTCRLLPTDELKAAQEAQRQALDSGVDLTTAQRAFIKRFLVGWPEGEVTMPDGATAPFDDEWVDRLVQTPGAPLGLVEAFYKGYEAATEGNSEPPVGG